MDIGLIIDCLEKCSAEKEPPPSCLSRQDAEKWRSCHLRGALEDALKHEGLIEEYNDSPNVRVRRTTYRGYLELARLIAEQERRTMPGWIKRGGWYALTAIASSALTILTTWTMKKLGL